MQAENNESPSQGSEGVFPFIKYSSVGAMTLVRVKYQFPIVPHARLRYAPTSMHGAVRAVVPSE